MHGKADRELTTEECCAVLDRLAGMGILYLAFSGGEILLREDLFEIAAHARQKGFLLRLMTNGILLDAAMADRIAPLHPWAVEISVYGADEQTHEFVSKVPGSYRRTMRAFRLLAERGVRSIMKVMLMNHNAHQYETMKEQAAALGAQFRCDPVVTVREDGDRRPLRFRISDQQHRDFAIRSTAAEDFLSREPPVPDTPPCGMGRTGFLIDPTGNVLPCVEVRKVMGNVRERTIEEIWADPAWNEVLPSWEKLAVCRSCTLRHFCVNCRGLALNEYGDLNAPARISCRGALMRMRALVDKGVLPADYPVPGHMEHQFE